MYSSGNIDYEIESIFLNHSVYVRNKVLWTYTLFKNDLNNKKEINVMGNVIFVSYYK